MPALPLHRFSALESAASTFEPPARHATFFAALKMYSSSESNRASTRSFITALNPLELTASAIEPLARLASHRGSDNGTAAIATLPQPPFGPRCGFIAALHLSASIATDPAFCLAAP